MSEVMPILLLLRELLLRLQSRTLSSLFLLPAALTSLLTFRGQLGSLAICSYAAGDVHKSLFRLILFRAQGNSSLTLCFLLLFPPPFKGSQLCSSSFLWFFLINSLPSF